MCASPLVWDFLRDRYYWYLYLQDLPVGSNINSVIVTASPRGGIQWGGGVGFNFIFPTSSSLVSLSHLLSTPNKHTLRLNQCAFLAVCIPKARALAPTSNRKFREALVYFSSSISIKTLLGEGRETGQHLNGHDLSKSGLLNYHLHIAKCSLIVYKV